MTAPTTPPDDGLCLRHYPASPVAPEDAERTAYTAWAEVQYRNADEFSQRDHAVGLLAWIERGRRTGGALSVSAPVAQEPVALGWKVRERRGSDGELLDCFVEAPAAQGMAYGLEVLGDDYNGYGDVEAKLKHCQMIVGWANAAPVAAQAQPDAASIHLQCLKKEVAANQELRQQLNLMEDHARGECWRWRGDDTDDLASMGNRMGVLIYACDLRTLLAQQPVSGADGLLDAAVDRAWSRFQLAIAPTDDELEEFAARYADEQGRIHDDTHATMARALLDEFAKRHQFSQPDDSQPQPSGNAGELSHDLLGRVSGALGRFVSDEGWGQEDMDLSDEFAAALAAQSAPRALLPLEIIDALNNATGGNEWQGEHAAADLVEPARRAISMLAALRRRAPSEGRLEKIRETLSRQSTERMIAAYSSLRVPAHPAEGVPAGQGWTGDTAADSALVMLDRIDTAPGEDARIGAVAEVVRKLAVDAARYRWIRGQYSPATVLIHGVDTGLAGAELDAAIDAARQGEGGA